jgi:hypothetical protein
MERFSIRFLQQPPLGEGVQQRSGELVIGSFREQFDSPLGYWDEAGYERQWHGALTSMVSGAKASCLVTKAFHPDDGPIRYWPMARVGEDVVFGERVVGPNQLHGDITPDDAPERILEGIDPKPRPESSQWRVPLRSLTAFLAERQSGA